MVRTIVRVRNGGIRNEDILDRVVIATTNRADGDPVSSGTGSACEGDVGAGVDGQAVVLVLDVGAGDVDTRGRTDIERISVMAAVLNIALHLVSRINQKRLSCKLTSELSIVMSTTCKFSAPLMEKHWIGVFLMFRPVMVESVKEWA